MHALDIALQYTYAGASYGSGDFLNKGCGMGEEATLFLTGQGVRVVGTDAWSWDAPFSHTARRYAAEGDPKIIWEGHKAGRIRSYYQMEKLHGLRSEEHTSELQSLMRISYAVFCLKKKKSNN